MLPKELEDEARAAALAWVMERSQGGMVPLRHEVLRRFTFRDFQLPLMDIQRGIRKPADFSAALSIRTVWRPEGAERPYDDSMGADGFERYKWRGDDAQHPENRALRAAMTAGVPLIWFWGVAPGTYQVVAPVYLVNEEPGEQQFVVSTVAASAPVPADSPYEEVVRRWVRSETQRRVHQPVFRAMVIQAYRTSCAVCELRHTELLDAAHIVEDKHERGVAAVHNGMALCKIHHAAYDAGILGVRPDLVVQIRHDILDEIDGPLLEHGIKALHGQPLRVVPAHRAQRPRPELLQVRYDLFKAAG